MEDYKEKLLKTLVEKYRKSKKDSGENKVSKRTVMKPTELYKNYYDNDGDLETIYSINELITECKNQGFISYDQVGFGYEIDRVYLIDEKIEEVENYLSKNYEYQSKYEKMQYMRNIIDKYSGITPIATEECEKLRMELNRNRIPRNFELQEDILKALIFIEKNETDVYLREASMFIYGSSKYFEENTLDIVCKMLRHYKKRPCGENEIMDEILHNFHITREEQKICIKGDCTIYFAGTVLELKYLKNGIEFSTEEIESIEKIVVNSVEFITVENKTSFNRYLAENAVVFYLGGYMTRYQRNFLYLIYQNNKKKKYYNFGDIDAGGFYIHEHLCRMTGIPFRLKYMSIEQLKDDRYLSCLQKLTYNDIKRLKLLSEKEDYKEVVSYMLRYKIKLEQEIVSYYMSVPKELYDKQTDDKVYVYL